jgi:hypothetical protein
MPNVYARLVNSQKVEPGERAGKGKKEQEEEEEGIKGKKGTIYTP